MCVFYFAIFIFIWMGLFHSEQVELEVASIVGSSSLRSVWIALIGYETRLVTDPHENMRASLPLSLDSLGSSRLR
jgi:hypothetical protein